MAGRPLTRAALTLLFCTGLWLQCSSARAFSLGGHAGLNLDHGDVHIGFDMLFPVVPLGPTVTWALWPSAAHVFVHDGRDVELLGFDMPFLFKIDQAPIIPFVGPGFGLAFYGDVSLKFNIVGGVMIDTRSRVKPFGEVALRFVDGTFVDLLFGVLVDL
ncbi:MAG: hypothetical protein ABW321_34350 [Polyangiales bacterium]